MGICSYKGKRKLKVFTANKETKVLSGWLSVKLLRSKHTQGKKTDKIYQKSHRASNKNKHPS